MEDFPSSLPEAKPNDNSDKKKKAAKKRSSFNAPLRLSTEEKSSERAVAAKEKPSTLDEALANLAIKKREAAEADAKTEQPEPQQETPEQAKTTEDSEADTTKETDEAETQYEALPAQEIAPNEFSGGEVIVHLQGDEPITERVISLHDEEPAQSKPVEAIEPPIFTRQPEQQHQAEDNPETPPEEAEPLPAEPPESMARPFEQPEPPVEVVRPRPEDIDIYEQSVAAAPNVATSPGERPATKQEVEDALYYAAKAGQNRGVLAGLLVGGGYEHLKHHRREKRQEKRFKKQNKQFEQTRADQHFFYGEQTKRQADNEQRFAAIEQRFEAPGRPEKPAPNSPNRLQVETPEQLEIPADHRLEASAWHSIEVDAKTGKPVENPTFQYGHEYFRERAQEASPRDQRNAAAGEVALVAAATSQNATQGAQLPAAIANIPNASMQGTPLPAMSVKPSRQPRADVGSNDTAPLWPWVVALIVVAICLIAVTR